MIIVSARVAKAWHDQYESSGSQLETSIREFVVEITGVHSFPEILTLYGVADCRHRSRRSRIHFLTLRRQGRAFPCTDVGLRGCRQREHPAVRDGGYTTLSQQSPYLHGTLLNLGWSSSARRRPRRARSPRSQVQPSLESGGFIDYGLCWLLFLGSNTIYKKRRKWTPIMWRFRNFAPFNIVDIKIKWSDARYTLRGACGICERLFSIPSDNDPVVSYPKLGRAGLPVSPVFHLGRIWVVIEYYLSST